MTSPTPATTASPLQLLLLGASGFVGSAVLRAAAALPAGSVRVRALLRNPRAVPDHAFLDKQQGELERWSADYEPDAPYVVLHFAVKQIDHDGSGFDAVNVAANRRLEPMLTTRLRGVIYGGSMSVYGSEAQEGVTEAAELRPGTALARSRLEAEHLWLRASERRGISCYLLRPRFVLGRGDRFVLPGLASAHRRGLMPGTGQQRFSIIDVDDYARIVLSLAARCAAGGATRTPLNVGYTRAVSLSEITAQLGHQRTKPRRLWRIPISPPWLRGLRLVGGSAGDALATRLELIGLSHWGQTAALEAEIGSAITARDPLDCVRVAASQL